MARELIISGSDFPGTNETLEFINDAIKDLNSALGSLTSYRTIVSGMELYSIISQPGIVYINSGYISDGGKILFFQGGVHQEHVQIINDVQQRPYRQSGGLVNMDAYRHIYSKGVAVPTGYSFPYSELKRLGNLRYVFDKLNGIAAGAEVNVQADWNTVSPLLDSYIKNKPTALMRVLGSAEFEFQTYGGFLNHYFTQNLGTTNYFVDVEVSPVATIVNLDATPIWSFTILNKTTAGFTLRGKQISGNYIPCKFKIKVWTNEIL